VLNYLNVILFSLQHKLLQSCCNWHHFNYISVASVDIMLVLT